MKPLIYEALDVERFPVGEVSRGQIDLVHDGLGRPMRLPVLVARGRRPGPVFGITAAVHGNELNGIPVIHSLLRAMDPHQLKGTVVGVPVVNVPGFLANERFFNDGRDLNLVMPGRPDGNISEVYSHRLLERIVSRFDFLIDLHTASFGRVNSLYVRADMTQPETARMAYLQRPQIILHNPPNDHTLRGAAAERGIPAITLEIGDPQGFQPAFVKRARVGVRSVLAAAKMLPRRQVVPGEVPVLCTRSYWVYTDHGGLLRVHPGLVEHFEEGDLIGTLRDIYGELVREYRAPQAGVVIGKSTNPVAQTGARILHLGVVAPPDHGLFPPREEVPELIEPVPERAAPSELQLPPSAEDE